MTLQKKKYTKYRNSKLQEVLQELAINAKFGDNIVEKILAEYELFGKTVGFKGRTRKIILATVTYGVLRKEQMAITLSDIAHLFNAPKRLIARAFKLFYTKTGDIPAQRVEGFIQRGVKELNLNKEFKKHVIQLYQNNKDVLRRFSPVVTAAACLYFQSKRYGLGILQREVATVFKISIKSIGDIIKILKKKDRLPIGLAEGVVEEFFIKKGIRALHLGTVIETYSIQFYRVNKDILRRCSPSVTAAICLHVQSNTHGVRTTQYKIATVLGVRPERMMVMKRILKDKGRLPKGRLDSDVIAARTRREKSAQIYKMALEKISKEIFDRSDR